jgi:hypothetical protein
MLNVDAGNARERPDNPRELRAPWRVTWLALLGIILFGLLFIAAGRLIDNYRSAMDGTPATAPDRGASENPPSP